MAKNLQTPCPAPKRGIPCELKLAFAMGGWTNQLKGFLYEVCDEYGADIALKLYQRGAIKRNDQVKNFSKTILDIFKLEGNDASTIGEFFDIWWEMTETEGIIFERSKKISHHKVTKCVWEIDY